IAPDWDLLGERLRSAIVEPPRAPRFTPKGRTTVTLAGAGPGPSIVRITARDQVGLLEAISRWFADHGVGILAADITTRDRTATDRFVVDGEFDRTALADHLSGPRRSPFRVRRPGHTARRSPPTSPTFHTPLHASGGNNVGIVVPEEVVVAFGRGKRIPVVVII